MKEYIEAFQSLCFLAALVLVPAGAIAAFKDPIQKWECENRQKIYMKQTTVQGRMQEVDRWNRTTLSHEKCKIILNEGFTSWTKQYRL